MNEPTITVIIPTFNSAQTIQRAVDSVLAQTRPAQEILVIDDGSTDDLASVLDSYGNRVRLLHKTRGGVASARNVGINHAQGELIAFLDADDYWEPIKLARQLEVLDRHPDLGLVSSVCFEQSPGQSRKPSSSNGHCHYDRVLAPSSRQIFETSTRIQMSTVLVRRSVLGRHRFDPGLKTAEDRDLWIRLIASTSVFVDSQPLCTTVLDPAALSRTNVGFHSSNMLRVVNRYGGLLGPGGQRVWEARIYHAWAAAALEGDQPEQALTPAAKYLVRQPLALEAWWVVLRCVLRLLMPAGLRQRRAQSRAKAAPSAEPAVAASGIHKRTIARNVIWNWAGIAAPMIAGLVVAPFLIRHLGEEGYGLWILLASFTGYFGMLDLGVRSSVGRYIAFYHAQNNPEQVNATLSTAVALLVGAGSLALLLTFAVVPLFFWMFPVPEDQVASATVALILVGLNLALTLPLNIFDATLWAFQRFDILNAIDIPGIVLRTALIFWFVSHGYGLAALALINLLHTVGTAATKALISFRFDRSLSVHFALVNRTTAATLFSYGLPSFMLGIGRVVNPMISPQIIANRLTISLVTTYNVAANLTKYANSAMLASSGVLTPVATTLHAQSRQDDQTNLFIHGGKYCFALALFFLLCFLFLGKAFIRLWVGPSLGGFAQDLLVPVSLSGDLTVLTKSAVGMTEFVGRTKLVPNAARVLFVLALGELLPMSQWVTNSVLLGKDRHRLLAWASLVENGLVVTLALLLARPFGLLGVCLGVAIPGTLCRGLLQMVYGCWLVQVSPLTYVGRVLLPPLAAATLPGLGLYWLTFYHEPRTWMELVTYSTAFSLAYVLCAVMVLGTGGERIAQVENYRLFHLAIPPE